MAIGEVVIAEKTRNAEKMLHWPQRNWKMRKRKKNETRSHNLMHVR